MSTHKKRSTHGCYSSFINIAKTGKQPKCPSVGEWINKLQDTQTMKYYSVLKGNELSSHKRHGGTLKSKYQVKEANLKGDIKYDSNYITLWKTPNYGDSKKVSGCQRHEGMEE